ncbi:MacB-like protein [Ruminiclostridium sufflavum DSM 19573]|uniref:MacB-like protein n=1 Tax=Ruminiclostridium sufflavum DSM 19573 TaxID=1121337 RepID=A0A318XP54_9FIRM|nr:ABC transporter permease [Ruminiclostridium sufflavum]PYG88825.1 MacB-like protein [Ruminiclostridium sufflavum DSM 19573]
MKSYQALAWKELLAQKMTSVLILIAIVLSTMMTTIIGQSIGILNDMRVRQAACLNGNRYATLHQLSKEQAAAISDDSRLSYSGTTISIGTANIQDSSLSIQLREYGDAALSAYKSSLQLESGKLPDNTGEIALPRDVLSMLNFSGSLGDTISLDINISRLHDTETGYAYSQSFTLTGILKANYIGYVNGITTGIVGKGTAQKVLPEKYQLYSEDIRVADKKNFQNTIDDLAEIYSIPDYCIQYNDTLLSALRINYREKASGDDSSGFSFMTLAGIVVGVLVLMAAGLVIYNILKIAVTKKSKEYGTLRAIGANRGMLNTIVVLQLILLCSIGIPAGILLGLLSSKGVTSAAVSLFSPEIFMASSYNELSEMIAQSSGGKILPLVISGAITLVFAFIASLPAAHYAAKVPPTTAMSGRISLIKRRNRKIKHILSFESFYARMNMKRNRGRTAITILSLIMSITVFIALQSFSGLLDTSAAVRKMHLGDFSVTNQTAGFSPEAVNNLASVSGISSISTLKYKLYMPDESGNIPDIKLSVQLQPGETLHIAGIDEQRMRSLLPLLSQQEIQSVKDGKSCLIKNPVAIVYGDTAISSTKIETGETISLNGKPLKVSGIIDSPVTPDNAGFTNGVQIIVYDTVYDSLTGQRNYTELYPSLSNDADYKAVENAITSMCEKSGGTWLSYQETDRQLLESYEQIRLLAWGLILLIGLIGILNIINTVYTNIHTRIAEIGIQRAVGMSIGSLYKTFLWEGAYYGIIAAAAGTITGYICTILANAADSDKLQLVPLPVLPMAEAAIVSIAACLIASCIPLRKIERMNIVNLIESV